MHAFQEINIIEECLKIIILKFNRLLMFLYYISIYNSLYAQNNGNNHIVTVEYNFDLMIQGMKTIKSISN